MERKEALTLNLTTFKTKKYLRVTLIPIDLLNLDQHPPNKKVKTVAKNNFMNSRGNQLNLKRKGMRIPISLRSWRRKRNH